MESTNFTGQKFFTHKWPTNVPWQQF